MQPSCAVLPHHSLQATLTVDYATAAPHVFAILDQHTCSRVAATRVYLQVSYTARHRPAAVPAASNLKPNQQRCR